MDLYISPLSCSFAAHLACLEAGLPVTLKRVDRATKRLDDGSDYGAISPLLTVPAIATSGGEVITEMGAVLPWIADRAPEKGLAPRWGSEQRYELATWIHLVSTEIHKKHLWMIFSSKTPDGVKEWARSDPSAPLDVLAKHLASRAHLLGDAFTVADAYLFWALTVMPFGGIALGNWPVLEAYAARIRKRPCARAAFAIEVPMFQEEQARASAVPIVAEHPAAATAG